MRISKNRLIIILKKIWAVILSIIIALSSLCALFPVITNAATSSSYTNYWGKGSGAHKHFYVNGKDAFCINYGASVSSKSFTSDSSAQKYWKNLGSAKQDKINQILTYSARKGYLNYSGSNTNTKNVYYSAIQRAIWQITDKTKSNAGLSSWFKDKTKKVYDDIMENYSKMPTADSVPSLKKITLTPDNDYKASQTDANKVLNATNWKVSDKAGLKAVTIATNKITVTASNYFSGTRTVKLTSTKKVYDLTSSCAGRYGKQYAIMTTGGEKTLSANVKVTATNDPIIKNEHKASVTVQKKDLTGIPLKGATFRLSYINQDEKKVSKLETSDENGNVTFTDLDVYKDDNENNGNPTTKIVYTLTETSAPDRESGASGDYFILNGKDSISFTLNTDEPYIAKTAGYNYWVNAEKLGDIKIIKNVEASSGSYTRGKNFVFKLVNNTTNEEYTAKTDENGEAYFCNVPVGEYTLFEINENSFIPVSSKIIEIEWDGNETLENRDYSNDASQYTESTTVKYDNQYNTEVGDVEIDNSTDENTPHEETDGEDDGTIYDDIEYDDTINGTINISLKDNNNNPIENAQFTIMGLNEAVFDIATTNENGYAVFSKMPGGTFIIRQDSTQTGYMTDEPKTVTITTENVSQNISFVNYPYIEGEKSDDAQIEVPANVYTFINNYKRGDARIIKSTEILGNNPLENGEYENLQGFKFTVVSTAEDNVMGVALKYIVITDKNGVALLADVPVGKYVISEVETPDRYIQPSDTEIEIKWDEETSYDITGKDEYNSESKYVQLDTLTNVSIKNTLKRVTVNGIKKDNEGNSVQGAVFGIFKTDTKDYLEDYALATSVSDENGLFSFSNVPYGEYVVAEIKAPKGYTLSALPQTIEVSDTNNSIELTFIDNIVKGQITITKEGDGFSSVVVKDGIYKATYDTVKLKDVVFEIYADGDIVHPNGNILYQDGELIETITTNEEGIATSSLLPLGKYKVIETQTLPGYYLDKNNCLFVDIKYADDSTSTISENYYVYNQRQNINIYLTKIMELDDEFNIGTQQEILNVKYGLFAAEEIKAADGSIIPADAVLDYATANKDGIVSFTADVPYGYSYYVKEVQTDKKYVLNNDIYLIKFNDEDSNVITIDYNINEKEGNIVIENSIIRGSIIISKTDVSTGKLIPGCKIEVLDENGNIVVRGMTDITGTVEFILPYGKYYYREYEAPKGYILDTTPHSFEITENGQIIKAEMTNDPILNKIKKIKTGDDSLKIFGLGFTLIGWGVLLIRKKHKEYK